MLASISQALTERRDRSEELGEDAGFTLIELMVVLLIMAILLAIAIPTFLGVTGSANDRAAQSNLNTALTDSQSVFQNNSQSFPSVANLVTALSSAEPNLTFGSVAVTNSATISVNTDTAGDAVVLAAKSKSGDCWYIASLSTATTTGLTFAASGTVPNTAGTWYGVDKTTSDTCSAASLASTNITWQLNHFPPS